MADPSRTTTTRTTTNVRHVMQPVGVARKNPPTLGQLREFVAACEGLPDSIVVHVDIGQVREGGGRDITFSTSYEHPLADGKGEPGG